MPTASSSALGASAGSHRLIDLVRSALDVRTGEGRPLVLLFLLAGLFGFARICFYAASNALFLSRFDTRLLPYVYIGTALVTALTGYLYSHLKHRLSPARLFFWSTLGLSASVFGLRVMLAFTDADLLYLVLPIWFMVVWIFGLLIVWGTANQMFDVQQGKRLFGLVGAGEVLSDCAAGVSISALVGVLGTANLMLISGGALFVAAFLHRGLRHYATLELPAAQTASPRPDYRRFLGSRYIVLIIILSALMNVVYYFVDLSFMREVQRRFDSSEATAGFLGGFYAALGFVNFVGRSMLTGRVLSRYGLAAGLLSLPVTVAVIMALVAVADVAWPSSVILFWLVVACMFSWIVLRDGIDKPATLLLYQPLPAHDRLSAQITVETVFDPLAIGIAGVSLLVLSQFPLGTVHLAVLTLLLTGVWFVVGRLLKKEYGAVLSEALAKRRLGGASINVNSAESLDILHRGLRSPHPGEVLYCLSVLAELEAEPLATLVVPLLAHPAPEVRLEALALVERNNLVEASAAVHQRAREDAALQVRAAALRTLAALGDDDVIDVMKAHTGAEEPEVRRGALVGLLRYGGIDGVLAAAPRLEDLALSGQPADRRLAAQVLGDVASSTLYRPLLALLRDTDSSVRVEALRSAARVGNPKLWPEVVRGLRSRDTRREAAATLVAAGDGALVAMEAAFTDDGCGRDQRQELARIAGRIASPRSTSLLLRHLQHPHPDAGVRLEILGALRRNHFSAGPDQRPRIEAMLAAESAATAWTFAAVADVQGEAATAALESALEQVIEQGRRRLFALLSFLYEGSTISDVERQLASRAPGPERANALEALEYLLEPHHRGPLLPLVFTDERTRERIALAFPVEHLGRTGRLLALLERPLEWVSPWSRVCVLHAMGRLPEQRFGPAIEAWTEHPDPATRQTAQWALRQLGQPRGPQPRQGTEEDAAMLTIERVLTLKSTAFFGGAPDETLAEVAAVLEEKEIAAGHRLITQGELGTTMYIVVDGELRVHVDDRTIVNLGPRSVVGELAALDPEPRLASVSAVRDTLLLQLDYETLDELISREPNVSRAVIRHLCRSYRDDRKHWRALGGEKAPS